MFESTLNVKYTEALNQDIGRLVPRFKSRYSTLERIVTKPGDVEAAAAAGADFAVASKLERDYSTYNDLREWHGRFVKENKPKKARKS